MESINQTCLGVVVRRMIVAAERKCPMSKLPVLYEALKRVPKVPLQRKVVMVTRLNCKAKQNTITELRAKDDFARVLGGYVLPSLHKPQDVFQDVFEYEVVTWNTGEASDLRWLANRSHAEAQLYELHARQDT